MISPSTNNISLQNITAHWLHENNISLDVLRLDKIHAVVSGNKWFKLQNYLQEAKKTASSTLATFGGAWSNHIAATAYACNAEGISCVGIIRGEEPPSLSSTLQEAIKNKMQLHFVSREAYKNKAAIMAQHPGWYWVNEGGYGELGAAGAAKILSHVPYQENYTHIVAAAGTGTMLAGLINSADTRQQVVGISALKGNLQVEKDIQSLLKKDHAQFSIHHNFHFGGYAKHPIELIQFINDVYHEHALPLDIIYTGKTFYAIKNLAEQGYFKNGEKILMIHSGGLQGNLSLPPEVLAF